jgi:CRISPR-associated protein Csb1
MGTELSIDRLRNAIAGGATAIRRIQRLVPAGGPGDKVFPPTYEGGRYALEDRIVDGRRIPCVLLDSVQSQANRMEVALREAFYRGILKEADIPVVTVDFSSTVLREVGEVTSLDAPHRLADAILRDSLNAGIAFRSSTEGKILDTASPANATGIYGICPTALVFGLWDSTGPNGGLGTKFQRCVVSEIVGFDIQGGVRSSSRIDPLKIERIDAELYETTKGSPWTWTLDQAKAAHDKDKPRLLRKKGKPSEANHGNVTPSLGSERGPNHGGVTLAYAQQTVVLSLPALRRLRFPDDDGAPSPARDVAARTALAALAIAGAQLSIEQGCDLRSRCLLVPDGIAGGHWEIIGRDGRLEAVDVAAPSTLLEEAASAAFAAGLPQWRRLPLRLDPNSELVELIRLSREKSNSAPAES